MEKIADVTGILCISVFVMGLFYQIGGFEKTAKVIRFIVAICIISIVFTGFKDFMQFPFLNDIVIEGYEYDYNDEFYNGVIYIAQEEIEKIIKSRLDEKNISYKDINVHILEQSGTVVADEITIICDNSNAEEVYENIKDILTEDTNLIIGE